jgi:peptidyl-tRNA hydrolase
MKIKVIYRRNLNMSTGKIAAQVAHAVKNLNTPKDCSIVVLQASDKKFYEAIEEHDCYVQVDNGITEVGKGTMTAAAWIDNI